MPIHTLKARLEALKTGPSWQGDTWRERRKYQLRHLRTVYNPQFLRNGVPFRWVEDTSACGLRFVGYVTEYRDSERFRAKPSLGWYADYSYSKAFNPVVFQFPTNHGEQRFAYGYADPWNPGAALLAFDPCHTLDDAQRWACSMTKRAAEESREEDAKFQAEQQIESSLEEIASIRAQCLSLIKELKAECSKLSSLPAVSAALRESLKASLQEREKLYSRIEELRADYWRAVAEY